ncbi:GPI anchored serine-threonine rich family protein [Candidatus Parcubacteria bacterium]|nr:GPI anchored serine-threonine rich family protein [Candidatus Parcubacteria bacterium]
MNTTLRAFLITLTVVCLFGIFPATVMADQTEDDDTKLNITVISPNGGEIWENGKTYTITWEQENIDKLTIFLQRGSTGYPIVYNHLVDINAEFGSYDYTVPENVPEANNYKIWIIAYKTNYGQAQDYSDDYFSIKTEMGMEPISDLSREVVLNDVHLYWSPVPEAASYNIYRASATGGFYRIALHETSAGYIDQNVEPGWYGYMVRWVNEAGLESSDSNGVSAFIPGMEPISDLSARAKNTKVVLLWTLPSEAVSTNIYRTSEEENFVLIANTKSTYAFYLDKNVPLGNQTYMIRWIDSYGLESPDSNKMEVSITERRQRR